MRYQQEKRNGVVLRHLIALQQAGGGVNPAGLSKIGDFSHDLRPISRDLNSLETSILEFMKEGYRDDEILRLLEVDQAVLRFVKRKLEKFERFSKMRESFFGEKQTFKKLTDSIKAFKIDNEARFDYVQEQIGIIWAWLGMSKVQIKLLLGVSDAKAKRFRSMAKEYGFVVKHIEPKCTSLEWRLLASIFTAFYVRIGGVYVMSELDPIAANESYLSLCRGMVFDRERRFSAYLDGFDNFVVLAKTLREKHISLEHCGICDCHYVKYYDPQRDMYGGHCPFCEFRDIYVNRDLLGA